MEDPLRRLMLTIEERSDSAENLGTLLKYLQSQEELLIQQMAQLDDLLPVLDPAQHTLGMIFILNCKAPAVALSNSQALTLFLHQCRRLLLGGDPVQVRMVPSQFTSICFKFATAAVAVKAPLVAIRALHAATCKLQPSPAHFTPLHAEFLKMCVLAKCYSAAQPILDRELLQLDKEIVTPRDLLLFHYYSGIVHVGMKRFKSAIQSFSLCFSAPTSVLSAIMVEAYKKCVLCSLIAAGQPPPLPKFMAPVLHRHIRDVRAPQLEGKKPSDSPLETYSDIVDSFKAGKASGLRTCLQRHAATLQREHNLGLAKQCVNALVRLKIRRLTQAYVTISLAEIAASAELAGPEEADKCIRDMVTSGEISAAIHQPEGMVHFTEKLEQFDSNAAAALLEEKICGAIGLAKKLHELHAQLSSDANYLSRVASQEKQSRWDDDAMLSK